MTVPGIPDFYQGSEHSALHLVDPDNRRPVPFDRLKRLLRSVRAVRPALRERELGRALRREDLAWIRGHVVRSVLRARRRWPELFAEGEYRPLAIDPSAPMGPAAFARRRGRDWLLVVAGRGFAGRGVRPGRPPVPALWGDGRIELPPGAPLAWEDLLTGRRLDSGRTLPLSVLLAPLPVAVLRGRSPRVARGRATRKGPRGAAPRSTGSAGRGSSSGEAPRSGPRAARPRARAGRARRRSRSPRRSRSRGPTPGR
jgi:(1->4)-alpha-D-glucan 1-alpha-D-glucosylmutase